MKKIIFYYILAVLLPAASCRAPGPSTERTKNNDFIIEPGLRLGPITAATTEEMLVELFGEENVRHDTIWFAEGHTETGTILFPGAHNEVEIVWNEEGAPSILRLSKPGADWITATGLKVGSSLQEVERVNLRPFQFYGFGWDFGGAVIDWKGGRMTPALMLTLAPANVDDLEDKFWGEVILSSDDPELQGANIVVSVLMISFD